MTGPAGDRRAPQWAAMQVRSPLYRDRPWLTDTSWVAHESLPGVARLVALMPFRGWWSLDQATNGNTATRLTDDGPDLSELIDRLAAAARPCVFAPVDLPVPSSREEAAAAASTTVVEVTDSDGALWYFPQSMVLTLSLGIDPIDWRVAPGAAHDGISEVALVGFDRKDRARLAIVNAVHVDDVAAATDEAAGQ